MSGKIRTLILFLLVFLSVPLSARAQQGVSAQDLEKLKNLTPAQQRAIQEQMSRTGGNLTPEAVEALKTSPDFKGLLPEDIQKGREILDTREKADARDKAEIREKTEKKAAQEEDEASKKSLFQRAREMRNYQDVSLDLKPFGYEFFRDAAVKVLRERKDTPVPLDYVVGPGDEIRVLLWGRVNGQHNLIVDRDGKINIPQIGPLTVAGMTFEKMSSALIKKTEQIVGTNIDISMGSMKTIPVFILGDVRQPGAYNLGSSSTITDALLTAGGPTEIGSMRKIQLRRKNKVITTFDLYDLLLKGDKSKDAFLQAGDVVFVPVVGPVAAVTGNVRRPAIYELTERLTLQNLFELAGGIIPHAYTQQIQIERIVRNEKQIVVDIDDKHLQKSGSIVLYDSDLVKVFSIVDMDMNVVFLNGNLKRPGKYEFRPGMRLRDVVKDPAELLPDTHMAYALVKRESAPGVEAALIPFSPARLFAAQDSTENIEVRSKDRIYFFNKWFFRDKPFVTVEGEVRGPFDLSRKLYVIVDELTKMRRPDLSEKLLAFEANFQQGIDTTARAPKEIQDELIRARRADLAEKVRDFEADLKRARDNGSREVKDVQEELKRHFRFDLAEKIRNMTSELNRTGQVSARDLREIEDDLRRSDRLDLWDKLKVFEGGVKRSFNVDLSDNMRVKDAILNAGGLTRNAMTDKGEIVRVNGRKEYRTIYFDVSRAMADDPAENLVLHDQDRIVVHSVWEQTAKKTVSIDGEVSKPGTYQYTENMTVKDLIFKGGNILESAYLNEAEISSIVVTPGNKIRFEQRIIDLGKALEGNPAQNVTLKPSDRLMVKRIPEWREVKFVTLTGEVKFPGNYPIRKGERLSSVIERAGGYTDKAYLRGAFFTRNRVRELQQKSLEETSARMERELLSEGAALVAKSSSADDLKAQQAQLAQKQKFVESIRRLKASGRMTIKLTHLRLLKGSEYDIALEDGDSLQVPEANNVVNVVGSVMSNGSFIYSSRLNYEDYVDMTGGYSNYADKKNVFVMKVDGSARKLAGGWFNWSSKRSRWELSGYETEVRTIEPGDVIVVPEKVEHISWLREIKDITQIMMQMAVTAGVVLKLY